MHKHQDLYMHLSNIICFADRVIVGTKVEAGQDSIAVVVVGSDKTGQHRGGDMLGSEYSPAAPYCPECRKRPT